MLNLVKMIAAELELKDHQVENVLTLMEAGGTVPFIARYRKEQTGELDETTLRKLAERHRYLSELESRKDTIIRSIAEQGKLTPALSERIKSCALKTELEDLYLPYKPKKRTRATVAKERGLEPLARWIQSHNTPRTTEIDLSGEAQRYVDPAKQVPDVEAALSGAADILAEEVSENAGVRAFIRNFIQRNGQLVSKVKATFPVGSTNYENYRAFTAAVRTVPAHNVLALIRGEKEGVVTFHIEFDEVAILTFLNTRLGHAQAENLKQFYRTMLKDALSRLLKPALTSEVLKAKKQVADEDSIETFAANLRQLLLASPAGMKPTLGIDPGFRTGCKLAVVDGTGKFLHFHTLFPHSGESARVKAAQELKQILNQFNIQLIAIGNGTAGRETDLFVAEVLSALEEPTPIKVIVSEAGASVYSASEVAVEEFADVDVTVRGAISIARRLQDPLAELVKIEPRSIGVGQYQHDVDPKRLRTKLSETVESCVNFVGVDLNTASKELLGYVAGMTPSVAASVIAYRNEHGAFKSRQQLFEVPRFGAKTFEQASGFLRIRNGENVLDNTAVHPERYPVVHSMAQDKGVSLAELTAMPEQLGALDLSRYMTDEVGAPTLEDIIEELKKPGRDPRAEFKYAAFRDDITSIDDVQPNMILEGVVTNVTNFGAFVDIGVHHNGLVHISHMANRFVKNPTDIVSVGQVVKVRVLEVNPTLKRIGLSLRLDENSTDH